MSALNVVSSYIYPPPPQKKKLTCAAVDDVTSHSSGYYHLGLLEEASDMFGEALERKPTSSPSASLDTVQCKATADCLVELKADAKAEYDSYPTGI